jgi:hypothetical protein
VIHESIDYFEPTSGASFSVSRDGPLAYQKGETPSHLAWVDRTGRELQTVSPPATFWGPVRLSPDGLRVAVSVRTLANGGADLWLYELGRKGGTRFSFARAWKRSRSGRRTESGSSLQVPKDQCRSSRGKGSAIPAAVSRWPKDLFRFRPTGGGTDASFCLTHRGRISTPMCGCFRLRA